MRKIVISCSANQNKLILPALKAIKECSNMKLIEIEALYFSFKDGNDIVYDIPTDNVEMLEGVLYFYQYVYEII